MNNDIKKLEELYESISKPDFKDVDKDRNTKESFKKAADDSKKECKCGKECKCDNKKDSIKTESKYKELFAKVISEGYKTVCGTKINPQAQYICKMDDDTEKTLKGESVIKLQHKCKSVRAAHQK
jgi:hypothetical protein